MPKRVVFEATGFREFCFAAKRVASLPQSKWRGALKAYLRFRRDFPFAAAVRTLELTDGPLTFRAAGGLIQHSTHSFHLMIRPERPSQ